jgi:hypothetical protein
MFVNGGEFFKEDLLVIRKQRHLFRPALFSPSFNLISQSQQQFIDLPAIPKQENI